MPLGSAVVLTSGKFSRLQIKKNVEVQFDTSGDIESKIYTEGIVRPYGFSPKKLISMETPLPEVHKENPGILLHPESMWYIFCPPPEPVPYSKLYIPIDPTAPPKPKLPKWLKPNKRTLIPPVLDRVMGAMKITAWMRKIAEEIIAVAVNKFYMAGTKINHRKIRREFRSRVSAIKRQQRFEKRNRFGEDNEREIEFVKVDPSEWGGDRAAKYAKLREEIHLRKAKEKKLADEAEARLRKSLGETATSPVMPGYKKGSGKFK